jgi:hypothetical protein
MQFAGRALPSPNENRRYSSLDNFDASGEPKDQTTINHRFARFDARKCAVAGSGLAEAISILAVERHPSQSL